MKVDKIMDSYFLVHLSPEEETNEITDPDNTPTMRKGVEYYFFRKGGLRYV